MTPQEFLIEFGNKQYGKNKDVPPETFNDPDLRFVIDAMIAYGNQEYNQAIDDLVADDLIPDKEKNMLKFRKQWER